MKLVLFGHDTITHFMAQFFQKQGWEIHYCYNRKHLSLVTKLGILNLPVSCLAYESIKDPGFVQQIAKIDPDYIISLVFGEKIPGEIITLARHQALNGHPAPLPEYRTGNAWFWPLRMGETESAVVFHQLTSQWDSGAIMYEKRFSIDPMDTRGSYVTRIRAIMPAICRELMICMQKDLWLNRSQEPGTYYPKLTFKDIMINWSESARSIHHLIRAGNPDQHGTTRFRNGLIYCIESNLTRMSAQGVIPGSIRVEDHRFLVAAGDDYLELTVLRDQHEGFFSGSRFISKFGVTDKDQFQSLHEIAEFKPLLNRKV